jgi:hypothetical protein
MKEDALTRLVRTYLAKTSVYNYSVNNYKNMARILGNMPYNKEIPNWKKPKLNRNIRLIKTHATHHNYATPIYRGISIKHVDSFKIITNFLNSNSKTTIMKRRGFTSFSHNEKIASMFGQYILRLTGKHIPSINSNNGRFPFKNMGEREVIILPGTFTLHKPTNESSRVINVTFKARRFNET